MKNKIIGILIFLFGFVMVGGIAYFFLQEKFGLPNLFSFFNRTAVEAPAPPPVKETPKKPIAPVTSKSVSPIDISGVKETIDAPLPSLRPVKEVSKEELLRLAGSFAERFGSYSNQSNFSNMEDLKIFMSTRMKTWTNDFISRQKIQGVQSDIYYGITTKAIAKEMIDYDDDVGHASVSVHTRRREATSSTNNTSKVFGQIVIIKFVKEYKAWKVDSASWLDQ